MANPKMTVEEILASCRATDGRGGAAEAASGTQPTAEGPVSTDAALAANPTASAAKKPSAGMSVEEMLAAARAEKSGGSSKEAKPAKTTTPADASQPTKKPSASMSVEEMLAAARGEKSKPAAQPAAAKGGIKGATAAKPSTSPVAKAKPAKGAAVAGPADTSSILAAARKPSKRGPLSKAEAAKQGVKVAPEKKQAPVLPRKPTYAQPKSAKATKQAAGETRRGFLSVFFGSFLALGFSCLAGFSALWGLGLARFLFPNILTEPPSRFKVGFPSDFPPGVVITKFKAQFGVWVVNTEYDGQPQIAALQSICTHLGCTPNWLEGEQKFKCPCHGSGFYKDGINFEGPAPRPLERYAIKLADDGQIEIDKSKTFQQEMGQWKESSSFIPV